MATISPKVFKHHKKADGTYNVKICIYHNDERVFIDTDHYVTGKKLTSDYKIKDVFINALLNKTLDDYRLTVGRLGKQLKLFSAQDLKDHLLSKDKVIDFIKFADEHINFLDSNDQSKSAANFRTVKNHLIDFLKSNPLPVENITLTFIRSFEHYLRAPKELKRKDQFGREAIKRGKGLGDASVHWYLRDFQGLFSAAMIFYNKPSVEIILIAYNPFAENCRPAAN
ncbi:MAG: phage integrase SAM-like domain-containing protein [Mucilaginibacter sp.]|uniref:phage integrase SAM-like domain-containing protein n=1 Tax=Mucilaginibacter sp. TaxID=1882438 RepID=UPI003263C92F